jgi:hypothetical protein
MSKNKKVILVIIGVIACIFLFDTFMRLEYEKPILIGKKFVINLMIGNKEGMIGWAGTKNLKNKIKKSDIQLIGSEFARNHISESAWKHNLQLYKAERLSEYEDLLLTYAYMDPNISNDVFTYTVELAPIGRNTLWDRSVGKLFHSENKRPTPKWAITDYYTNSDMTNYAKSLNDNMKKRIAYMKKRLDNQSTEELMDKLDRWHNKIKLRIKNRMEVQNKEIKKYLKNYMEERKQADILF